LRLNSIQVLLGLLLLFLLAVVILSVCVLVGFDPLSVLVVVAELLSLVLLLLLVISGGWPILLRLLIAHLLSHIVLVLFELLACRLANQLRISLVSFLARFAILPRSKECLSHVIFISELLS
jgi:hypothetical protein